MSYEALALKQRPQKFSDLTGQEAARVTLTNGLKTGRLHPVCLFTGPRGTGKTSAARILAKALRCESKPAPDIPCCVCEECLSIHQSQNLNVIEIDGASNNGVEAVRELRDTLNYMPSSGSQKVYIIDEVHMLSTSAFNALLKTLEEPPPHIQFIMATTEAHKIPLTVTSRCQKFDFHLIPPRLLKERLEKTSREENIAIDDKTLWLLAKRAGGSLRDGQSLLDQTAVFCGGKITYEKAAAVLCLSDPELIEKTLRAISQKDENKMLSVIEERRSAGADPKLFLENIIEGLRDLLLLKQNPKNDPPLVNRPDRETEEMKEFSKEISAEDLHFLFDIALKGERDQALCHDGDLALDVLLLKLAGAPRLECFIPFNPLLPESEAAPAPAGGGGRRETKESENSYASAASAPVSAAGDPAPKAAGGALSPGGKPAKQDIEEAKEKKAPSAVSAARRESSSALLKTEKPAPAPDEKAAEETKEKMSSLAPPAPLLEKPPLKQQNNKEKKEGEKDQKTVVAAPAATKAADEAPAGAAEDEKAEEIWPEFMKALKSENPFLEAALGLCSLQGRKEDSFLLRLPAASYARNKVLEKSRFLEDRLNLFLKTKKRRFAIRFQGLDEDGDEDEDDADNDNGAGNDNDGGNNDSNNGGGGGNDSADGDNSNDKDNENVNVNDNEKKESREKEKTTRPKQVLEGEALLEEGKEAAAPSASGDNGKKEEEAKGAPPAKAKEQAETASSVKAETSAGTDIPAAKEAAELSEKPSLKPQKNKEKKEEGKGQKAAAAPPPANGAEESKAGPVLADLKRQKENEERKRKIRQDPFLQKLARLSEGEIVIEGKPPLS